MRLRRLLGPRADEVPVWLAALLLIGTAALSGYFDKRRAPAAAIGRAAQRSAAGGPDASPQGAVPAPLLSGGFVRWWDIPWPAWKRILWRTYQRSNAGRLLAVAAGVVFFGLLALFPAISAFVSFYGLFASYSAINQHLAVTAGMLPPGAVEILREQVERLVANGDVKLSFGFVLGTGLALWSANAGMKAIIDALNVAYEEKEKRSFLVLNLVSLAFTLGAIVALLLAVGAVVVVPLVPARFGLGTWSETLLAWLRWPALFVFVVTGLAILYRFGPSRTHPQWEWLNVGTLGAASTWIAGSALFSWYLSAFANYDATYGSLGAAIGLMMWMWMSVIIILFGAELNSEIERPSVPAGDSDLACKTGHATTH
jgi:membrane protein